MYVVFILGLVYHHCHFGELGGLGYWACCNIHLYQVKLSYQIQCVVFIFQDFIPVMAEKYGFKYELIQYKWPRWLNQQTEKQRIMWV